MNRSRISLVAMVLLTMINVGLVQNDAMAMRGELHLDGILVLRTERNATAKIIVLPIGYPASAMDNVAGKFNMSLRLDEIYLLSFEREGMVTKQVYFDTSVPVEKLGMQMTFPFQVTLYPIGKDGIYAYAGPVGYVHYDAGLQDFTYETDYTLMPGAPMTRRIQNMMTLMADRGPDGIPTSEGTSYVSYAPAPSHTADNELTVAVPESTDIPTISLADILLANPTAAEEHAAQEAPSAIVALEPGPLVRGDHGIAGVAGFFAPSVAPSDNTESGSPSLAPVLETDIKAAQPVVSPAERTKPITPAVVGIPPVAPIPATTKAAEAVPTALEAGAALPGPTEELIMERNRVITVVRITEVTGHVTEYRRVVDRSGMVTYFQDGVSIPEATYRERTGR